ncbi:hypothetical protein Tco_0747718 [Tanacetum coccineum]|uniref:Xylulose kinase-1 n=1 Tax=Tanacetum coccineum TaxID=301880 RepID=A0ABQ4YWD7_9ASTR
MANLGFCDKHNMVAYLKKPTGSKGFQEIVDFLNGSHIRYALTKNPTIYVSLIKKFWQTATVRIVDNGEQEITAMVDGKEFTITEASVRRHLQLANVDGISVLPTTKIFDQLSMMGYVLTDDKLTFQKGKFSPQWRFLIHTILHCLSSKKTSWEQFSSNIATAIICLATNRTFNFSKLIFAGFSGEHTPLFPSMIAIQETEGEGSGHPFEPQPPSSTAQPTNEEPIPNVVSSLHQKTQTPRQALNQEWDDRVERATTTAASLDTEQASGNINRTQSTTIPNVPLPQGNGVGGSPRCQEAMGGSIPQTRSERKVESLEADLKQTKQVYGAAYTKLIIKVKKLEKIVKTSHSRRRAKIVVSDDEEASEDSSNAAKTNVHTYTRRRRAVSTGSGGISTAEESVSTAGASMSVSTAGMVQEVNISIPSPVVIKDKGKAAVRLQEELDEEERQMMARVHEATQSFTEEEWENTKARVKADEELSRRLQAEERNKYNKVDQAKMLVDLTNQRKKYFAAQKAKAKRNKPMTQAQQRNYMIN